MSRVTDALKEARQQAGLSQRQLAAVLDLSPAFINDIEHGRREFGERHYEKLPEPIRSSVVKAALADLRERGERLRQIIKATPKDG